MISLTEIFRGCALRRCAVAALLVGTAAVMGCSKEDTPAGGSGEAVLVRLPGVSLASPVEIAPGVPGVTANSAATHGGDLQGVLYRAFSTDTAPAEALAGHAEGLFSVTLGTRRTEDAAEGSPTAVSEPVATRADVALTNVWVFQFDASGNAVRCERVDVLGAGRPLEVHLDSGEGYTIGVVANGPASGLSTSNVPDLATFREGLLFTSPVASDDAIPYAGTLDGVNVLASGQVQVGGSGIYVPYIQLRRIMAQVTVELTHDVDDYALDGVELYSVPVGTAFAPDRAAAAFPAGEEANFAYRDNAAAGLAPHVQSGTGGTDHSYTWYVGQNRRGSGTGITKVQDKNASKAPAYATYARVKTHSTTFEDAPLYYDIYLGEDMLTDFNVTANHIYVYDTRIVGRADEHYSLIDTDGRVSGVKPIHISSATVTPAGDIPGEGKTYSLTLTGVFPSEGVDVRANIEGADPVTGKVTASGEAVALAIPGNHSYDTRSVTFEYYHNGKWNAIGNPRAQQGYYITAVSVSPTGDIPVTGGTYTFSFKGWGGYRVAAVVQNTTEVLFDKVKGSDTQDYTISVPIPENNSGNDRGVYLQYYTTKWHVIELRTQKNYENKRGKLSYQECETACAALGGLSPEEKMRSWNWRPFRQGEYWTADRLSDGSRIVLVWRNGKLTDFGQSSKADKYPKECRCTKD